MMLQASQKVLKRIPKNKNASQDIYFKENIVTQKQLMSWPKILLKQAMLKKKKKKLEVKPSPNLNLAMSSLCRKNKCTR